MRASEWKNREQREAPASSPMAQRRGGGDPSLQTPTFGQEGEAVVCAAQDLRCFIPNHEEVAAAQAGMVGVDGDPPRARPDPHPASLPRPFPGIRRLRCLLGSTLLTCWGLQHGTVPGPIPCLHHRPGKYWPHCARRGPQYPLWSRAGWDIPGGPAAQHPSIAKSLPSWISGRGLCSRRSLTIEDVLSGPSQASSTLLGHFYLLKML